MHSHSRVEVSDAGLQLHVHICILLIRSPNGKIFTGAGNSSLVLKLMSKIALAEGQESWGVRGMLQTPPAACHHCGKLAHNLMD